jgi:ribosomal protein S18 acetylase RimI-like enzyme
MPVEEWEKRRLDAPDTDLSLWFVARDGGGWIGAVGVVEGWRRRGIGRALLLHAFGEFHRRGAPHAGLGVDVDNPTGATRLYEGVGMRVVREDVVYEKELR